MNYDKLCLKNGRVWMKDHWEEVDLLVEKGRIEAIGKNLEGPFEILDCTNQIITSSFTDLHVHFRDPGDGLAEDVQSGSKAALAGGYTHVFEMPNTNPCLDHLEIIQNHLEKIEKEALCVVRPFSAATKNLQGKEMVDVAQIAALEIAGFSDDGKGIQDRAMMKNLLIEAGKLGKMVSAHCEDEQEFPQGMGCMQSSTLAESHGFIGINHQSEYAMIQRDLSIISEIHGKHPYKYHVCHLSCKKSLELIQEAKRKGYFVSCEVTPHHLISSVDEVDVYDGNYKMNPPLRTKEDVDALQKGLLEGSIDAIATDHAPHPPSKKQNGVQGSAFGIIGLEMSFSLLYTALVQSGKVPIEVLFNALSRNPSELMGLDKEIKIGNTAYLTIIDEKIQKRYTQENIVSKSKNTFYLNQDLNGVVVGVVNNQEIYRW